MAAFSIEFVNDFGSDVRVQASAGPNDPHYGGCDSNTIKYDNVIPSNTPDTFTTDQSNVCWRRSSGPGHPDDPLPVGWNIVEWGNDSHIQIKLSDQT
jgi:hypothetical protein